MVVLMLFLEYGVDMKHALIGMEGQVFDRLTVLRRHNTDKNDRNTYWLCRCVCGNERVVSRTSLITGNTKSCGCLQKEKARNRFEDIKGQSFGRLTVIGIGEERSKSGHLRWLCRCSCGFAKEISGITLRSGKVNSCGCLHREAMRNNILPNAGSGKNKLFGQYANKAIKKGRSFDLTEKEFFTLTDADCHYCGAKPSQEIRCKTNSPVYRYNGIDRVDNTKGYDKDNCVSCCSVCNYAKRRMSREQFLEWVSSVYHHVVEGIRAGI